MPRRINCALFYCFLINIAINASPASVNPALHPPPDELGVLGVGSGSGVSSEAG